MFRREQFSNKIHYGILLQTVLTVVPVIILIIYINIVALNNAKNSQIDILNNSTKLIASEQTQILEGSRQLLITLSTTNQIKYPGKGCSNYLQEVLQRYQRYTNIALADTKGNVVCSAVVPQKPVNIADRYFFKSVTASKSFTVGEYSLSKITNESIISFAYPVYNDSGVFNGVIYASLDLKWLSDFIGNLDLSEQSMLVVVDKKGIVLANGYNSNSEIGNLFLSEKLVSNLKGESGFVEANINGKVYFLSFHQIGSSDSSPYVIFGSPRAAVFRQPNIDFEISIGLSLVIIFCSVVTGWLLGERLIRHILAAKNKVEQLKRDFVSLVSHQLRTPLTAMKYFDEILLSESPGKLVSKQKEFLNDSLYSVNKMISLVGVLLNISKLESGKIDLNCSKESISELIEKCQVELKQMFVGKRLRFSLHNKCRKRVLVDAKLLSQVITNLLNNAVKYSVPASLIQVRIVGDSKKVTVSVKNKGIVIEDDERINLFTKFYRSNAAKRMDQEGSGLGLYLCKLIVEQHGGRIGFTSSKRFGTTFWFTLPL